MSDDHGKHEEHDDGGSKGHGGGGHGHGGGGGHSGGAHEEHEGAPEWLISFADNVALMMGFFVILLAMNMQKPKTGGIGGEGKYPSQTPTDRMDEFAIEMRKAFHNPVDINSTDPHEQELVRYLREHQEDGETNRRTPDGDKHNQQASRTSNFDNINGYVTFPDGTSVLNDAAKKTLQDIANHVRGTQWIIEVRGHVSAAEAKNDVDRAYRLSFERALVAANVLMDAGVRREQIRPVACGDSDRATPRAHDEAGQRNNQRAEVVITQQTMPKDPYEGQ